MHIGARLLAKCWPALTSWIALNLISIRHAKSKRGKKQTTQTNPKLIKEIKI